MFRILLVNDDFKVLEIPLPPEQRRMLESKVAKGEQIAPITCWQGYVLYSHIHFGLYMKYHRTYQVEEKWFAHKNLAIAWICREQLKRPDLCRNAHAWLISRLFEALQKEKKRQSAKEQFQYKQLSPSRHSSVKPEEESNNFALQNELGKEFHCSWGTIRRHVEFGRQLDQLEELAPGIRIQILTGNKDVTFASMPGLLKLPYPELLKMANDPKCTVLALPKNKFSRNAAPKKPKPKPAIKLETGIKEMPRYNPDAGASGLTYTICAWAMALKRAQASGKLKTATQEGRERLHSALKELNQEMERLNKELEVYGHDTIW